jgi:hypothetical protein
MPETPESPANSPKKASPFRPYLARLAVVLLACTAAVFLFNEGMYLMQREIKDRPPKTIQLVIPAGTAERVAAGEKTPSLPEEMTFVVGDVLEVINQDSADHEIGPVWVPAGSTGSMVMDKADRLAYTCSFQPDNYLGVDVIKPTSLFTRLVALFLAAPTVTALVYIYSLALYPIDPAKQAAKKAAKAASQDKPQQPAGA